jgi:hypothetical protein
MEAIKVKKRKKYKYPISRLRGLLFNKKGRIVSKKTREKMSKSKKGKLPANLDILHSPKVNKKRADSVRKFWLNNPYYREQLNAKRSGSGNPNWKKGRTKFENLIRRNKKYLKWRQKILQRDCPDCSKEEAKRQKLQVHHLTPFNEILLRNNIKNTAEAMRCEELWDINNGIVLRKGEHRVITLIERQKTITPGFIQYLKNLSKELNKILKKKQKLLLNK